MKHKIGNYYSEILETDIKHWDKNLPSDAFIIIDETIYDLYSEFSRHKRRMYQLKAREKYKNLASIRPVIDWLYKNNANRSSSLVAVGGGITTDIAGWISSNYMRGCHLILVPTTLIAMIDASIGGKTGVNYKGIKNLLGSFYPAEKIIPIHAILDTLTDREFNAGLAELIKAAILQNGVLINRLIAKGDLWRDDMSFFINEAINYKFSICEEDMEDRGKRRILNLGHTFAHVIESASDFRIEHGRAVAIGIIKAAQLSHQMKMISVDRLNFIVSLLKNLLPADYFKIDLITRDFIDRNGEEYFLHDKKSGKKSTVVLFNGDEDVIMKDDIDWNQFKDILLESKF